MECPRCKGDGKCTDCDGSGWIPCLTCDGKGERSTPRGNTYNCKSCQGEGKVECPKECSSCGGSGVITEELQKETREKYRPKFANLTPTNALTIPILLVNLGIYILMQTPVAPLKYLWLTTDSLSAGYYWTLITASFVHFDFVHILMNMWFLWIYGPVLEGLLGKKKFLLLYFFTALTAGGVSYWGNVMIDKSYIAGVGASGPLFGLVGAIIAVHLRWKMIPRAQVQRLATWMGIILIGGFALRGSDFNIIDNWGHLGGLVGGFLLMYVLPRPRGR